MATGELMFITNSESDFWKWLGNIANLISLVGFLVLGWLGRLLLSKDNMVSCICTKGDVPTSDDISGAMGILNRAEQQCDLIKDLETTFNKSNCAKFLLENGSRIADLKSFSGTLNLFLFAHMPIVVALGAKIQIYKTVNLFFKRKGNPKRPWKWEYDLCFWKPKDTYLLPQIQAGGDKRVALMVEGTFSLGGAHATPAIAGMPLYELKPGIGASNFKLRYRHQLGSFRSAISKVMNDIEAKVGSDAEIHLFLSVPPPFAFILGQAIHIYGPKVLVYDNDANGNYKPMIEINQ